MDALRTLRQREEGVGHDAIRLSLEVFASQVGSDDHADRASDLVDEVALDSGLDPADRVGFGVLPASAADAPGSARGDSGGRVYWYR
jgi:hypothetical protein